MQQLLTFILANTLMDSVLYGTRSVSYMNRVIFPRIIFSNFQACLSSTQLLSLPYRVPYSSISPRGMATTTCYCFDYHQKATKKICHKRGLEHYLGVNKGGNSLKTDDIHCTVLLQPISLVGGIVILSWLS